MERTKNMPLWVFLAFASIETKKAGLMLTLGSLLFAIYCLPWTQFYPGAGWIEKVFLVDDWSWFGMMVPIFIWYALAFRWIEKNACWDAGNKSES
ncbi:MAG: hypothetical protein WBN40_14095 [Pseudomonadales bacterium]